jgi:hypothetical protein
MDCDRTGRFATRRSENDDPQSFVPRAVGGTITIVMAGKALKERRDNERDGILATQLSRASPGTIAEVPAKCAVVSITCRVRSARARAAVVREEGGSIHHSKP